MTSYEELDRTIDQLTAYDAATKRTARNKIHALVARANLTQREADAREEVLNTYISRTVELEAELEAAGHRARRGPAIVFPPPPTHPTPEMVDAFRTGWGAADRVAAAHRKPGDRTRAGLIEVLTLLNRYRLTA